MTPKQKLLQFIKSKTNIPEDIYVQRTYAGRHQKSAGAWTACFTSKSKPLFEVGMYVPMAKLAKCPNLSLTGTSVACKETVLDCGCTGKCKGL